jgi:hypothetical protein
MKKAGSLLTLPLNFGSLLILSVTVHFDEPELAGGPSNIIAGTLDIANIPIPRLLFECQRW